MAGFPEFYKEAHKAEIIPIIGQELYITDDVRDRPARGEKKRMYHHLVVLARNLKGYQTLVKIATEANKPEVNFYQKPRVDFTYLESIRDELRNLICLTACLGGHIPAAIEADKPKRLRRYVEQYQYLFKHLYLELMWHPQEDETQLRVNEGLVELAERKGIPIVITNDVHYVREEQQDIHRILVQSSQKGKNRNPDAVLFGGKGYHLKSEEEMKELFPKKIWRQAQGSLEDIYDLTKKFHVPVLDEKKFYIPTFPRKNTEISSADYIMKICRKRLKKLDLWNEEYRARLKMEMEVVQRAKFEEEFLIVRDYIRFAHKSGIYVGAGRGSMAGVLIAYLLGITGVDPIRYRLLFERALNPARPSLPDFDVDFQAIRRDEIIRYVEEKYGKDNVVQVSTFGAMAPKGAVRAVLRALDVPYPRMVEAAKHLPDTVEIIGERRPAELKELLEDEDFLKREAPELLKLMGEYPQLKEWSSGIQGTIQSFGTHAAGVIISDGRMDIRKYIPTMWLAGPKRTVTQYDMAGCKSFGFVKFDILGLNTLDTISDAIEEIGFNPFDTITEFEDKETFDMMNRGELATVFQMQGFSCRQCINAMGIKTFEDVIAINALSRPGAMKFLEPYHQQRDNPQEVKYLHPKLKPILEMSNGVLLYQEQTMQIALDIAGWDHHITDDLKEAIKYKKSGVFKTLKPKFIEGCVKQGVKKSVAKELWGLIRGASGYQFNRAHSVSYAIIAYQTAYLKCHYPAQWFTAYLRNTDTKSADSKGKLEEVMSEARKRGVKFLPPDVNSSGISFTVDGNNIRFGLSQIKGVGLGAAAAIVSARASSPYTGLDDLAARVTKRKANSKIMDCLEGSAALESIGVPCPSDVSAALFEYLGVNLKFKIKKRYRKRIEHWISQYEKELQATEDEEVVIGGVITNGNTLTTRIKPDGKGGEVMGRLRVDFYDRNWDVVVFPRQWRQFGDELKKGAVVLIKGLRQASRNGSVILNNVRVLG